MWGYTYTFEVNLVQHKRVTFLSVQAGVQCIRAEADRWLGKMPRWVQMLQWDLLPPNQILLQRKYQRLKRCRNTNTETSSKPCDIRIYTDCSVTEECIVCQVVEHLPWEGEAWGLILVFPGLVTSLFKKWYPSSYPPQASGVKESVLGLGVLRSALGLWFGGIGGKGREGG